MISLFLYVLAAVLFVICFFMGGVHVDQATDLAYLALAIFCLAHVAWDTVRSVRG